MIQRLSIGLLLLPEYKLQHTKYITEVNRQPWLHLRLNPLLKRNVIDLSFFVCLFLNEIWNPQLSIVLEKDAASRSSDNLPTTKHMCKQDFFFVFCLSGKQDYISYSFCGDEAGEVLTLQLMQKWKLQLPWSLYRLCSLPCH